MELKPKLNCVYLDPVDGLFTVTHIAMYLLMCSENNKAITVEYINNKEEFVVSWAFLRERNIKYLGDNLDTARILYEKSIRTDEPVKESIIQEFMGKASGEVFKHLQDPADVLEKQAELEEEDYGI